MKKTIKFYAAGLLTGILLFGTTMTFANTGGVIRELFFGVNVLVDGIPQQFADDMRPFITQGRTYLPVRGIADVLGVDVNWDGSTRTVFLTTPPTPTPMLPPTPAPVPVPTPEPDPMPIPAPTQMPTPTPRPALPPTNLTQMDFFTASPVQEQNRWFEWSSVLSTSIMRNADSMWQDNAGNTYHGGGIFSRGGRTGGWDNRMIPGNEHSITFLLNSQYTRFTGTAALSWDYRDNQHHYYIRIFGDDRELFTSSRITGGTLPIAFDVNVTDVTQLRIERLATGTAEIGVMNPLLHR